MNLLRLRIQTCRILAAWAISCIALTLPGIARSQQVDVTPIVTSDGALFRYDFTIANGTAIDLSLVEINVAERPDAIRNLVTPEGFDAVFDPVFGTVDFREVTSGFDSGSRLSGFGFESPFAPDPSTFQAFGVDATTDGLVEFEGQTLAPTAVPEPGPVLFWSALLSCGLLVAGNRLRARWLLS